MYRDNNFHKTTERYCTVRQNLDDLGYKQAFSLDSLPLIELLLFDLAQSKENLEYYKSLANNNKQQTCSKLQLGIEPYKCDNAKLVQECNQVHLELIKTKEENLRQSYEYKKRIKKLEGELCDAQKSFSRSLHRIRQLESESLNKTRKISELIQICKKPNYTNINFGITHCKCKSTKKSILEAESYSKTSTSRTTTSHPLESVNMGDQSRINCLSNEITKLKEDLYLSNECVEMLKSEIHIKEKEMARLRKLLEGGRPCSAISKDHTSCYKSKSMVKSSCTEKSRSLERCKSADELKSLQKEKQCLEKQLKEAMCMQHDAMKQAMHLAERNEELEKQLKAKDRSSKCTTFKIDCCSTDKDDDKKVTKLQDKLECVMSQVHLLESELTVQRREAQELRADLEACKLEKCSVQRALESTLEEKKRMTDRINNMTATEKNPNSCDEVRNEIKKLGIKIGQLKEINKGLKSAPRPKLCPTKPSIRSCTNNKIKEKGLPPACNAFVKKPVIASRCPEKNPCDSKSPRETRTPRQSSSPPCRRSCSPKACACRSQSAGQQKCSAEKTIREKDVIIDSLQCTIRRLECERDKCKEENEKLKCESQKDSDDFNRNELWSQICELRAQMSEKEHTILKLMREKKELCQEKFTLENKLKCCQNQTRSSSQNTCACGGSSNSDRSSSCLHKKVEKLEQERNSARADVERLCEERDALRDRLKIATATHVSEQCRLRAVLADVESRLNRLEQERNELLSKQGSRRVTMNCLDEQVEELTAQLARAKEELCEQRTQYYQLRTLQDQMDQTLADVQGQLTQCEIELSNALDRNKNLERQQLQTDNQMRELKQEINTHRSRIAQLDCEKDQLLMDLDEKTEKIAVLEQELCSKEQKLNDMGLQCQDAQHSKHQANDQVSELERAMRNMQLDLENLQRQLSSACMERESAIHENSRLQDELAALSCEVRNMHKEVECAKSESQDLKRQLQTYVSEVRRAEDLINQKENERTEMLNHFRSLSMEASVLESNNHSLENEATEAKCALQTARDQVTDLERQLSDKECLMRGYEDQINELSQTVASLEIQLQQAVDERECAEKDLRTMRDLCMSLESQKDCLNKQLDEALDEKSQSKSRTTTQRHSDSQQSTNNSKRSCEIQLARYRSEQDIFQDQMNKDHKTIDRLERMLEDARRDSSNTQSNSREMQCEVSRLKQKIADLQCKLSNESSELRKYQTQASEYCKQISELRRQVNNERFDKAKKKDDNPSKCTVAWKDQNNKFSRPEQTFKPTWTTCCEPKKSKPKTSCPPKSCISKTSVSKVYTIRAPPPNRSTGEASRSRLASANYDSGVCSGAETSPSDRYNVGLSHRQQKRGVDYNQNQSRCCPDKTKQQNQQRSAIDRLQELEKCCEKSRLVQSSKANWVRQSAYTCEEAEDEDQIDDQEEEEDCNQQYKSISKKSCGERRKQGGCQCAQVTKDQDENKKKHCEQKKQGGQHSKAIEDKEADKNKDSQKKSCKERRKQGGCPCSRGKEGQLDEPEMSGEESVKLKCCPIEAPKSQKNLAKKCSKRDLQKSKARERFNENEDNDMSVGSSTLSVSSCGRCWKKNQFSELVTPSLVADTLHIMERLIDKKRNLKKKCNKKSGETQKNENGDTVEDAEENTNANEETQPLEEKESSVVDDTFQKDKGTQVSEENDDCEETPAHKDEEIQVEEEKRANNQNCEATTQTAEGSLKNITATDLVNILEDIQRYAQSIQEYFIENRKECIAGSEKQSNKSNSSKPSTKVTQFQVTTSREMARIQNEQQYETMQNENMSNFTLPANETRSINFLQIEGPATSTPRGSKDDDSCDSPSDSAIPSRSINTFSSCSSLSIDSSSYETTDLENDSPSRNEPSSSKVKEIYPANRERKGSSRKYKDFDDSTKYMDPPTSVAPNRRVKKQINEVYADMETVQDKIARLKKELLMDNEELQKKKNNLE